MTILNKMGPDWSFRNSFVRLPLARSSPFNSIHCLFVELIILQWHSSNDLHITERQISQKDISIAWHGKHVLHFVWFLHFFPCLTNISAKWYLDTAIDLTKTTRNVGVWFWEKVDCLEIWFIFNSLNGEAVQNSEATFFLHWLSHIYSAWETSWSM